MLYLKLLGHYYKDGLFSDSETPIVKEATLGNKGTIRLHSDKEDTLYVVHEDLANVPSYVKDEFKNCMYTSGALIYEALSKDIIEFPWWTKITVVPNYEKHNYIIYWPIEKDDYDKLVDMDGKLGTLYRYLEVQELVKASCAKQLAIKRDYMNDLCPVDDRPTDIMYQAPNGAVNLSVKGTTISASDVACDCRDVLEYNRPFTVDDLSTNISYPVDNRILGLDGELNQNETKGKEKENMNNLFGNLRVGKAGSNYSITYFGTVAYKGKTWYNNTVYDCQGMTIDLDLLYLVPTSEINSGDIIEKDGVAYHVNSVADGKLEVVNLVTSKEETLLPGGPFGMTLYSKVYNPMGGMGAKDNNLGNMLLMQSLLGNKGGDNSMLVAMMMMQGGFTFPAMKLPETPAKRK